MNATFTPLTLTPEEQKVIDFAREFHAQNGQVPAIRRICRECNISAPWFYRAFRNLEGFCERAGIKIDRETLVRIKGTRKATKRRTREKRRQLPRDSNPLAPPTVECEAPGVQAGYMLTQIREDAKKEKEAHKIRVKNIKQLANTVKDLALYGDFEINSIFLEALNDVIPVVLFYKYDIAASVPDLLAANDVLHQVHEERRKLNDEEKKNATERADIAKEWERLKRDSDKASLLEHVERLKREQKINVGRFNEAYYAFKQFRMLFREIMPIMRRCPTCYKTVIQNMMESHDDVLNWLTSGKMRLSFEIEDTSKLVSRT